MKRLAVWAFYGIGALAIGYLALYAYAAFTGRDFQPGDPIHIFRKPDVTNEITLRLMNPVSPSLQPVGDLVRGGFGAHFILVAAGSTTDADRADDLISR